MNGDNLDLVLNKNHPQDHLLEFAESLDGDLEIDFKNRFLFILPDGISIRNARHLVSREYPSANEKIKYTTFERMAKKILSERVSSPSILEGYYLNTLLTRAINELSGDNEKARKINDILKNFERSSGRPRERCSLVDNLSAEFNEFLRAVYPPSIHSGDSDYLSRLKKINQSIDIEYEKNQNKIALEFYKKIEEEIRSKAEETLGQDRHYLSRAHLVSEANEKIKSGEIDLKDVFPNINDIKISAITVFDTTIFQFVKTLSKYFNLEIVVTEGSHDRIKKRFQKNDTLEPNFLDNDTGDVNKEIEKWEIPTSRQEVDFVASLLRSREDMDPKNTIVIARDTSKYLPYARRILSDYGFSHHVETRRNLSTSIPFRLVNSLFNILQEDEWSVEDISNPLRLGFIIEMDSGKRLLSDRSFLMVEYWLNRKIGRNKEKETPLGWMEKFRNSSSIRKYINQLYNWKNEVTPENIDEKLIKKLDEFQIKTTYYRKQLGGRNGLDPATNSRTRVTDEHLNADVERVIALIRRANEFSQYLANLEDRDNKTIFDFIRAFWIIGGASTYGKKRRDKQAIKFVDAANSYFLPQENRIILGMNADTFPRKPPETFLFSKDFVRKINNFSVNKGNGDLYFQSAETDFENEEDFFNAALGRINEKISIYQVNPYLDERGHRNRWSIFSDEDEAIHIKPSDFYFENNKKCDITPSYAYNQKSAWSKQISNYRFSKNNENSTSFINSPYEKYNPLETRLEKFKNRVISSEETINLPDINKEEYLKEFIQDFENIKKVPAHELDLWRECELKHYFYYFVFYQRYWKKNQNTDIKNIKIGSRYFIPNFWDDFQIGKVPERLMRCYISTDECKLFKTYIDKFIENEKISNDEVYDEKARRVTKRNIVKLLKFLDNSNIEVVDFENEWTKSNSKDFVSPPRLKVSEGNVKYYNIARYNTYILSDLDENLKNFKTFQQARYLHHLLVPSENNPKKDTPFYFKLNLDDHISEYKQRIRVDKQATGFKDSDKCKNCVYNRLCGWWGFDE
ncbi:hypothetical protein [Methanonatronarchaeum sp. AMET-Sl]|uniref:hypothetical protein n=1 Tax=Methanonatronarchaeum sp. AMET-Sl TaxID=3037654 RepID=UPI00244DC20C|nr:hypothetical protein [Methanonatronarchaeum sp. AMET-Sl]WGI17144.1 hypothetical protein QEN48_06490 [Methanonatronarchaeum sp. AMET-Sl]